MSMYPTGWGWVTVGSGMATALFFGWKGLRKTRAVGFRRLVENAGAVVVVLFLLLSFAQWAEWYK